MPKGDGLSRSERAVISTSFLSLPFERIILLRCFCSYHYSPLPSAFHYICMISFTIIKNNDVLPYLHNMITVSLNLYLHMSIPRPQYPLYITKTPLKLKMIKGSFIYAEIIVPISPEQKHYF